MKDFRWQISKKKNYFRHETNIPLVLSERNLMPHVAEFVIHFDHYILVTSLSNLNNSLISQYQSYIFILQSIPSVSIVLFLLIVKLKLTSADHFF